MCSRRTVTRAWGRTALQHLTLPRLSGSLEVLQQLALSPHIHLWLSSSPRNSFSEGQREGTVSASFGGRS